MADRFRVISVGILLLLCGLIQGALAQRPVVRLSPDLPMPVLPASIRIQAAGVIGERTLAVWGSTVLTAGDSIRPVLYARLINGRRPSGSPIVISLDDADPTTWVGVVSLRDRFLVVWNEIASRVLRTRARVVDINCVPGADFLLADTGRIGGLPAALRRGNGWRLLWNDTLADPLAHALDLDASGRPLGSSSVIGSYRVGGIVGRMEDAALTILDRADHPPLLFDDLGEARELTPDQLKKLAVPYDIGADGTVVSLVDSTIAWYDSPLDTVPFRTLVVHPPDSAYPRLLFPSLDPSGRVQVSFAVAHISYELLDQKRLFVNVVRVTNVRDSIFDGPTIIAQAFSGSHGHCDTRFGGRITDMSLRRGCRGEYDGTFQLSLAWEFDCQGIHKNQSETDQSPLVYNNLAARPCGGIPTIVPFRVGGASSSIALVTHGDTIILSAPVAQRLRNIDERDPGIVAIGDTILAGFISAGAIPKASLMRWNHHMDWVDSVGALGMEWPASSDSSRWRVAGALSTVRASDRFLLCQSRAWYDHGTAGDTVPHGALVFYAPSTSGWGTPTSEVKLSRYCCSLPIIARSEPDAHTCTILASDDQPYLRWWDVISIDLAGRSRWSAEQGIRDVANWVAIVPVDSDLFLGFSAAAYWRSRRGLRDSVLEYAGVPPYRRFERLRGGVTIGVGGGLTNGMLYDRDGSRVLPAEVPLFASDPGEPFILQSPRDSSIVMLYAANGGIRLVRTDRMLKVVRSDTLVILRSGSCSSPMATIIDDSLAVVWSEKQGDSTDVWGTLIPLPPLKVAPTLDARIEGARHASARIAPNPANDRIVLHRPDPTRAGRIIITDMMGRMVWEHECAAGEEAVAIDTSSLAPGLYMISIAGEHALPLVVAR